MTEAEMDTLTKGMRTKSAKIRALSDQGVSRSDIARYLGIRYQHVRNVLVAPRPMESTGLPGQISDSRDGMLTIDQAKRGLALQFSVPIDAIEITIRG